MKATRLPVSLRSDTKGIGSYVTDVEVALYPKKEGSNATQWRLRPKTKLRFAKNGDLEFNRMVVPAKEVGEFLQNAFTEYSKRSKKLS